MLSTNSNPLFANKNRNNEPHVVCVMITGYSNTRIGMAIQRAKMFLRQTYNNKSLLILNDGQYIPINHPLIHQIKLPKIHSLGTLRNIALDLCYDSWVCQWDDDDIYPIDKIERQVTALIESEAEACVYRNQIIYNILSNCAVYYTSYEWYCIEGTILHRPTNHRYPAIGAGEDTVFIENFKDSLLQINNEPEENIKLYHGNNVWDDFKLMPKVHGKKNRWEINIRHQRLLSEELNKLDISHEIVASSNHKIIL